MKIVIGVAECLLFRSIEVIGRIVGTLGIVCYIAGVRCWGMSAKWGSTVEITYTNLKALGKISESILVNLSYYPMQLNWTSINIRAKECCFIVRKCIRNVCVLYYIPEVIVFVLSQWGLGQRSAAVYFFGTNWNANHSWPSWFWFTRTILTLGTFLDVYAHVQKILSWSEKVRW